jgi:hypothetical protein
MSSKRAALDDLKTWKENKSRATLFWLGRKQALVIKKGKSIVGTSLVDAAAKELPNFQSGKRQVVCRCKRNERAVFSRNVVADLLSITFFVCAIRTTCLIFSQKMTR